MDCAAFEDNFGGIHGWTFGDNSRFARKGDSSTFGGFCWATCLAAASTVSGQTFAPAPDGAMPGPITAPSPGGGTATPVYGEPNTGSVYSPAQPQAAFGPPSAAYGPGGIDPNYQMQNLSYQSYGDYANPPYPGASAGPSGYGADSLPKTATWLHIRDLQTGVYTNHEQTVIVGGSTFEFFVNDQCGLAGRFLLGGVNNKHDSDRFHYTGDLYAGTTKIREHWIKGGVLYDAQGSLHKIGPTVGALLFAEYKHPISINFAYGIGNGSPVAGNNGTTLALASDDTQFRAGTYITPNLQAGFSGNWLNYTGNRYTDYNGYGGYANLNLGLLNIIVDVTTGENRTRGFVNVAYTFGGRRARPKNDCGYPVVVDNPRDWITKPVIRDISLQMQQQGPAR